MRCWDICSSWDTDVLFTPNCMNLSPYFSFQRGSDTQSHRNQTHTNTTGWPQQEVNILQHIETSYFRLTHHFCSVTEQLTPGIISAQFNWLENAGLRESKQLWGLRQYGAPVSAGNKAKNMQLTYTCSSWPTRVSTFLFSTCLHVCLGEQNGSRGQKTHSSFKITFKVYSKKKNQRKNLQENTWLPVIHREDIS